MSTRRRTAPPVRRAIAPPQPSNPGPPPPPPPPAKRVKYYTPKEEQEEEEEAAEYDEYIGNHSPEPEADVVHIMIRRPPSLFISEEDREMVERTKRRMLKQEEAYHHCGTYREHSADIVLSSEETDRVKKEYSPFEDRHTYRLNRITSGMTDKALIGLCELLRDPAFEIEKVDFRAVRGRTDQ